MKKNTMDNLPTLSQPVERYANSVSELSANVGVDTSGIFGNVWDVVKTTGRSVVRGAKALRCKACKTACDVTVC